MLKQDRGWFFNNVPKKERNRSNEKRPLRINYSELDKKLSQKIKQIVELQNDINTKPRRITETGLLRQVKQLNRYKKATEKFPLTHDEIENSTESYSGFLARKIRWAIYQFSQKEKSICIYRQSTKKSRSSSDKIT